MAKVARTRIASPGFRAVIAVALFVMFGFGLIIPTLPLFARRFGVGDAGVGLLLTVFSGTRLVGDLFAGSLIDRYGERPMAALGATIVGVSSLSAGAAPSYPSLVALRGIGGVGSALFLGSLIAYLIGTVSPEERGRAMGAFQAVVGIGFLLGPVFGGLIAALFDVNAPLYFYGAICLAAAPLMLRVMRSGRVPASVLSESPELPEEPSPSPSAPAWQRLKPLLRDSAYRAALVSGAAMFISSSAMETLVPGIWRNTFGLSKKTVGIPFTAFALMTLAVIWHAGGLADRRGRKYALVPALAASAIGFAALGFASTPVALVATMAFLGIASGYTRPGPTAIVADVAPPASRGVAVSGYRTATDIGAFIGPIMAGVLSQLVGRGAAFLAAAAALVVNVVVVAVARETAPARARE